jgi:CRP/FNR family cyclic AMP-dependent transcriptional regulator
MAKVLDLCTDLTERRLAAGEVLLEEGKSSHGVLYVLVEGLLEVLKGDVQIATVSEPGAFFGEMSLLLDIPVSATVRALEPSVCHVARDGERFLNSSPAVSLSVARLLARRLHLSSTYLADLKRQYEDAEAGLAVVDEVLEALTHQQLEDDCDPGSDRDPNY